MVTSYFFMKSLKLCESIYDIIGIIVTGLVFGHTVINIDVLFVCLLGVHINWAYQTDMNLHYRLASGILIIIGLETIPKTVPGVSSWQESQTKT